MNIYRGYEYAKTELEGWYVKLHGFTVADRLMSEEACMTFIDNHRAKAKAK
jgi:hypothetical protein